MTTIDQIVGRVVNEQDLHTEIVHHRLTVMKDALYIMDLIKRTNPPKAPEIYDVHRPDGRFAYHHIVEYKLKPNMKNVEGF